jgi:hypothetical protein
MKKEFDPIWAVYGAIVLGFALAIFTMPNTDVQAQLQLNGVPIAQFAKSYSVPTNAPYYIGPSSYSINYNVPSPTIKTNGVSANQTNGTLWSFPTDKRTYRFFAVELMDNQISNTTASTGMFTNYVFLYASGDEGRYNSNTPSWSSGPLVPQTGSTNLYAITNVPAGIFDNCGYVFAGLGNQGTNSVTNILIRFMVTPISAN